MCTPTDELGIPTLPDNGQILMSRIYSREQSFASGARIGDFIIMADGTERRVAHDWG